MRRWSFEDCLYLRTATEIKVKGIDSNTMTLKKTGNQFSIRWFADVYYKIHWITIISSVSNILSRIRLNYVIYINIYFIVRCDLFDLTLASTWETLEVDISVGRWPIVGKTWTENWSRFATIFSSYCHNDLNYYTSIWTYNSNFNSIYSFCIDTKLRNSKNSQYIRFSFHSIIKLNSIHKLLCYK